MHFLVRVRVGDILVGLGKGQSDPSDSEGRQAEVDVDMVKIAKMALLYSIIEQHLDGSCSLYHSLFNVPSRSHCRHPPLRWTGLAFII